ncbi:MAG TPA: hydrogenase, partial [Candidatus Limnocylindria bacterium]
SLTLLGLLLMSTRRKAISQVIGLITIENGVFLAGLGATLGLPLFVEIGVFFDLLIALTVLAVFSFRINEHFDTVNTDALRELRG